MLDLRRRTLRRDVLLAPPCPRVSILLCQLLSRFELALQVGHARVRRVERILELCRLALQLFLTGERCLGHLQARVEVHREQGADLVRLGLVQPSVLILRQGGDLLLRLRNWNQ